MMKHISFNIDRLERVARMATVGVLIAIISFSVHAQTEHLRDVIGASNYSPSYTLQSWPVTSPGGPRRDVLNEAAQELLDMGSRVIRVMLNANPPAFYHYTANPGYTVNPPAGLMSYAPEQRITETAKTLQYNDLFSKPFTTFIITIRANIPVKTSSGTEHIPAFSNHGSAANATFGIAEGAPLFDGLTSAELAIEKEAIKRLATHFYTAFAGSNKTFVITTGESDWIAREPYWGNQSFAITQARIDAMKAWVQARQDGVNEARAQYGGSSNVKVYNAVEVNHVTDAINQIGLTMTNNAIPALNCDLYGYTAYDVNDGAGVPDPLLLHRNLSYLSSKTPDSGPFGSRNIFLGEYLAGENNAAIKNIDLTRTGGDNAREVIRRMTETALGFGVRYALLWQVFGSDLLPGQSRGSMDQVPPPNSIFEGAWLRRPDGTYPPAYYYYQSLMSKSIRRLALRSSSGYYTSADEGGGYAIRANASSINEWEWLTIVDRNGGSLTHGDSVNVLTWKGNYFMAWDNGGGYMDATSTHDLAWETFTIVKPASTGLILTGETIALRAGSGHYAYPQNGGGLGDLFFYANAPSIGPWQTFVTANWP